MSGLTREDIEEEKRRRKHRVDILSKLTNDEKSFVRAYLDTKDAIKSAIRTNITPTYARKMLQTKRIRFAISVMEAYYCKKLEVTPENIINHLKRIIDANVYNLFDWSDNNHIVLKKKTELTPELCYAIDEMTMLANGGVRVKLKDKLKALDQLSKIEGMYRERLEITGAEGGPLQMQGYDTPCFEALTVDELKEYRRLVEKMQKHKVSIEQQLVSRGQEL